MPNVAEAKNVFAGMDIGSRYYKNYRTYTIFGGIE